MKNKIINEFGTEKFECSHCGELVDEFDSVCDTCKHDIASIYESPLFESKEKAEGLRNGIVCKILELKGLSDNTFGECILVEANPIVTNNYGSTSFVPYVNNDTLRFIYPETQDNISFLTRISNSSLLEVCFSDFQKEHTSYKSKSIMIYRHKSFYKHNTYLPDRLFFNGAINPSLICEAEENGDQKIILPNGDCYVGEIKNNTISGWGDYYFANGKDIPNSIVDMFGWQMHGGNFKNGLPNGIGYFTSESGDKPECNNVEEWGYFLEGKKNGVCFCTHNNVLEVSIYCNNNEIQDLTEDFLDVVNISEMAPTFWYQKLGVWIGTMYSDHTNDYNGLLILNNGECYLGTLLGGFNRTRIRGVKIFADGIKETGEWTLDINGMEPTEWAFV